jgi:hypothetical protein
MEIYLVPTEMADDSDQSGCPDSCSVFASGGSCGPVGLDWALVHQCSTENDGTATVTVGPPADSDDTVTRTVILSLNNPPARARAGGSTDDSESRLLSFRVLSLPMGRLNLNFDRAGCWAQGPAQAGPGVT